MIQFKIFAPYSDHLKAGMTLKKMGSFKEDDPDFKVHLDQLGLGEPALTNQTHSDLILEALEPFHRPFPEVDALMTQQKDLLLMVKVADCQGVIIYDPKKNVLACIHSGWKGSVQNIIGKTIQRLRKTYDSSPEDLLVAISPSLGPCCSEFTDPHQELPEFCHSFILPKNHVNFWALSKKQCEDEGVKSENIELPSRCTKCDPDFFSYRLGDSGRMAVVAKLL